MCALCRKHDTATRTPSGPEQPQVTAPFEIVQPVTGNKRDRLPSQSQGEGGTAGWRRVETAGDGRGPPPTPGLDQRIAIGGEPAANRHQHSRPRQQHILPAQSVTPARQAGSAQRSPGMAGAVPPAAQGCADQSSGAVATWQPSQKKLHQLLRDPMSVAPLLTERSTFIVFLPYTLHPWQQASR
jgi:hypothetical protein